MIPRVSIVILNWNGWKDTIECLESLYRITHTNYDVILVDNGSNDESTVKIKGYATGKIRVDSKFFRYNPNNKPIKVFEISEEEVKQGKFNKPFYEKFDSNRRMILLKNKDNYGFAGGNNVGIKFALSVLNPEYILILNNDTVVDPNFLSELLRVAESDEKIGITGPKIYYYDYNGRSDIISFTGQNIILPFAIQKKYGRRGIDDGKWNVTKEVDSVEGSCMLLKKEIIENVGLLNEHFFAYWEEVDLCFRTQKKGYHILYIPWSKIWHKESVSFGDNFPPLKIYLLTRNKVLFLKLNSSYTDLIAYIMYFIMFEFWILALFYIIVSKDIKSLIPLVRGFLDGILSNITTR